MKKFFKSLGIFLACLPFVMIVALLIWGKLVPRLFQKNLYYKVAGYGHSFTRFHEADTSKQPVDVLVVGSSHAYRGVDPRIFAQHNIKIFNLGSGSQTPIQTLYLLNRYIDKFKPKAVLYEALFTTFTGDGSEAAIDLYSNLRPFDKQLVDMAVKINSVQGYTTLFYAWLQQVFFNKSVHEPVKKAKDTYVKGGYVEREVTVFKEINSDTGVPSKFVFEKNQLEAFNEILALLKQKGVKLILFQTPVTKSFFSQISDQQTYDNFLKDKGDGYYNFNYNRTFAAPDFYDSNHLNQNGVDKLDSLLIDTLKANKVVGPMLFAK
ncbi:MAG: hypothetical protein V4619_10965 [Bacteroidota bacterium]